MTDTPAPRSWVSRIAIIGPLALFLAFVLLVAGQLGRPTQVVVTSKMIGQPLPALDLPGPPGPDGKPGAGLVSVDFTRGKPVLVNVFASWCLPCQAEAPQLAQLARMGVTINGIAVRDAPEDIAAFLQRHGNPFAAIGLDTAGRTQIAMGSSGVPESFVIDGKGRIRYQHIGEITALDVPVLMRQLAEAEQ